MTISLVLSAPSPTNSRAAEIGPTLRRGTSILHTKRNKGKVEWHKLKTQGILDNLNALSTPLDDATPMDYYDAAAATYVPESGAPLASPSPIPYRY